MSILLELANIPVPKLIVIKITSMTSPYSVVSMEPMQLVQKLPGLARKRRLYIPMVQGSKVISIPLLPLTFNVHGRLQVLKQYFAIHTTL